MGEVSRGAMHVTLSVIPDWIGNPWILGSSPRMTFFSLPGVRHASHA